METEEMQLQSLGWGDPPEEGTPVSPVALDRAVDYFADDGGLAAPHLPCYLDRRPAQLEEEVYSLPVLDRHLSCHVGNPFLAFAGHPARTRGHQEAVAG